MKTNGAIWCTSDQINGGRSFFDQAVVSAKSFKRKNPSAGTAIFRDEESLFDDVFDYHFPVHADQDQRKWTDHYRHERSPTKKITNLKVWCSERTPFEKTIHLDADTFVLENLDEVYEKLSLFGVLFTYSDWTKKDMQGRNIGCQALTKTDAVNSGVYAFRNDPKCLRLLGQKWRETIDEKNMGEQGVLQLYIRNPDVYLSDVDWMMLDNVIYNATRRMWRAMSEFGLWDEAKILHFNRHDVFSRLLDGEISRDDLLMHPLVRACDPAWLRHPPRPPLPKSK